MVKLENPLQFTRMEEISFLFKVRCGVDKNNIKY